MPTARGVTTDALPGTRFLIEGTIQTFLQRITRVVRNWLRSYPGSDPAPRAGSLTVAAPGRAERSLWAAPQCRVQRRQSAVAGRGRPVAGAPEAPRAPGFAGLRPGRWAPQWRPRRCSPA